MNKILSFFTKNSLNKKGRKVFSSLPFFMLITFISSCAINNPQRYGRVTIHSAINAKTFTFTVTEKFLRKYSNSNKNSDNQLLTNAENRLLKSLLEEKNYCMDNSFSPSFKITSRQEKVYDMTFAHLIEKNYNAKPLTPRMYFGQCL